VSSSQPADDDENDSCTEGDPFFDPKGKGKGKSKQVLPDDSADLQAEREAQEQLDAALARALHEQSVKDLNEYQRTRHMTAITSSGSSSRPPPPEYIIHDSFRQDKARQTAAPIVLMRLDKLLPTLHNVAALLLPVCGAELLLMVVAPLVAYCVFVPLGKIYFLWIDLGSVVSCLLGLYLGGLCIHIQKAHLPSDTKPLGVAKNGTWKFKIISTFDLAAVLYLCFLLCSICMIGLSMFLSLAAWRSTYQDDTRTRALFSVLLGGLSIVLLLLQLFAVAPLVRILRCWAATMRDSPPSEPQPQESASEALV